MSLVENLTRQLDIMDEEQQATLKAILEGVGISIPSRDKDVKSYKRKPKESNAVVTYNLMVHSTCKLCDTKYIKYFFMTKDFNTRTKTSVELTEKPKEYKVQNVITYSCGSCREVLMQKPKEELISMLLSSLDMWTKIHLEVNKK